MLGQQSGEFIIRVHTPQFVVILQRISHFVQQIDLPLRRKIGKHGFKRLLPLGYIAHADQAEDQAIRKDIVKGFFLRDSPHRLKRGLIRHAAGILGNPLGAGKFIDVIQHIDKVGKGKPQRLNLLPPDQRRHHFPFKTEIRHKITPSFLINYHPECGGRKNFVLVKEVAYKIQELQ